MSMIVAMLLAAAPAMPAKSADPAAVAAAEKLMDATNYDKLMDDMVETMITGHRAGMEQRLREAIGDKVDDALIGKIGAEIETEIRAMFREEGPQMRKAYAVLYATNFTSDELERLAVLQSDPVVKKSIRVLPGMMNEVMTLISGIVEKRKDAYEQRLRVVVEEHMGQSKG